MIKISRFWERGVRISAEASSCERVAKASSARDPPRWASGASPEAKPSFSRLNSSLLAPFGRVRNRLTLRLLSTIFFLSFDLNLVRFTGFIFAGLVSGNTDNLSFSDADCTKVCFTGCNGSPANFSLAPVRSLWGTNSGKGLLPGSPKINQKEIFINPYDYLN